jgi:thymidylate synthase ThyX
MNCKVYTHPDQPQMQVEVILASQLSEYDPNWRSDDSPPIIYTIRMRYPRVLHGEIMTHRLFSRNARSSRAVPVRTMLLECTSIPFVPWHWGANQKGMQATEECDAPVLLKSFASNAEFPENYEGIEVWARYDSELKREEAWLSARDVAVEHAEAFMDAGYHKQNVNRLLEPFSWIDTLITSTDWNNFLHLRDHKDAEPHLQDLAHLVKQALDECEIHQLDFGQWHLPYITAEDIEWANRLFDATPKTKNKMVNEWLCKLSAARCARISYKPFDGDASYEREIERYNSLVTSERIHASPLEHQATPDQIFAGHIGPYGEYRVDRWEKPELHGNLRGFIQFRKTIDGECLNG